MLWNNIAFNVLVISENDYFRTFNESDYQRVRPNSGNEIWP